MNRETPSSSTSGTGRRSSFSSLSVMEASDDENLKLHLGDVSMGQIKQLFGECQVNMTREDMDRLRRRSMSSAGPRITRRRQKVSNECLFCGKQFPCLSQLEGHFRVHTRERPFECSICQAAFKHLAHLQGHKLAVHSNAEKKFGCDLCGMRFHFKFNLDSHVRRHVGERSYRCDICGRSFVTCTDLWIHKRQVHLTKRFKCSRCPRVFALKYLLVDHYRTHTDERPAYKCDTCQKSYYFPSSLQAHKKFKNHF